MDSGVEADSVEPEELEEFAGVSEVPEEDFLCCHSTSSGEPNSSVVLLQCQTCSNARPIHSQAACPKSISVQWPRSCLHRHVIKASSLFTVRNNLLRHFPKASLLPDRKLPLLV